MNCQQADKYIFEYCDGRLSPELLQEIEAHLLDCEVCSNLAMLTRMENEALKEAMTAAVLDMGEDFTGRVMASLTASAVPALTDIQIIKPGRFRRPAVYWAAAAAIVLLLAASLPALLNNFSGVQNMEVAVKDSTREAPPGTALFDLNSSDTDLETGSVQPENTPLDQNKSTPSGNVVMSGTGSSTANLNSEAEYGNSATVNPHLQTAMLNDADSPVPLSGQMEQDSRTLGAKESSSAKIAATPDRYRSYPVNLAKPQQQATLIPDNLPDNYVLTSNSDNIFVYTEKNTGDTVQITVNAYTAIDTAAEAAVSEESIMSAAAGTAPSTEHLEIIGVYEESQYLVSLESNLSHEELLALASEIKLTPAE